MSNTTSKSTAPGLTASGARYSGNVGMVATFKPALSVPGTYNVFVTMGSGSNNNANASYSIDGASSYITGNVALKFSNSALVDKWLQLESSVYFDLSVQPSIAFTNVDGNSGSGHRFVMDAVKFELVAQNTETKDWQLY